MLFRKKQYIEYFEVKLYNFPKGAMNMKLIERPLYIERLKTVKGTPDSITADGTHRL